MARPRGVQRAEVIHRIKGAIAKGLSASKFISKMKDAGLGYRRSDMLTDWRAVGKLDKKEGLMRYVRKDYYPTNAVYADVGWKLSKEYLYKVRVNARVAPGEPEKYQHVNIISDRPMTPNELETEIVRSWAGWYPDKAGEIDTVTPETAVRRIVE